MKILHLNDHAERRGGVESYLHQLLPCLAGLGHDLLLAHGNLPSIDLFPCVHVDGLSSPRRRDEERVKQSLVDLGKRFQPDLIHIHNTYSPAAIIAAVEIAPTVLHLHDYRYMCPASSFYYRRLGKKCPLTCSAACFAIGPLLGCQTPRPVVAAGFHRRVLTVRQLATKFHAVLANSNYVLGRYQQSAKDAVNPQVLPYFVDPSENALSTVSAPIARSNKPYALFVGRIREDKGIFDFVHAIAICKSVHGRVVGAADEQSRDKVLLAAKLAGCGDRILVEGWKTGGEVKTLMRDAIAVVFPSRWAEPFGLVGVESLLQGTPVVACDVGGVRDWLLPKKSGYLVNVGDVNAIARHLERLATSNQLRNSLGSTGKQFAEKYFGRERHVSRLLDVYKMAN